jgi:transposase
MKTAYIKERELIVKLHKEGKKQEQIASILGCSQPKVSFWVRRCKKSENLENKPRSGRPTALTKKKLSFVKGIITDHMIQQNAKHSGVTSKEIKRFIEKEAGKAYTLRHVQRLLHKMGFSLITPRVNHIRRDQKAIDSFKGQFKKNLNRNIWTMS